MPKPIDLSASRGAGILGLSAYQTPTEIWLNMMEEKESGFCEKRKYVLPEKPDSPAINWGLAFEDVIIDLAQQQTSMEIVDREKLFKNDFLTCHVDGIYKNTTTLHEGKTTNVYYFRESFGEPGTDRIPQEYQVQVQHQMLMTGFDRCILSVLVFPNRVENFKTELSKINCFVWGDVLFEMGYFHQYEIQENRVLQMAMLDNYIYFWENFVEKKEPPPTAIFSDFKKIVPSPSGTIISNENVDRWHAEYKQINDEKAQLEKRKEQLRNMIMQYMHGKDTGTDKVLDDDSTDKWILRDNSGKKLFQYNGKTFR